MPPRRQRRQAPQRARKRNPRNPRSRRDFMADISRPAPSAELKTFQTATFNQAYFNTEGGSSKIDLSAVTQGNSGAQRVGDHLYAHDLRLWLSIFNGIGTTANGTNYTRCFVLQYKQDNGRSVPLIADFLQTSLANGGVNTYGSLSSFDVDYDREYNILWDSGPLLTYGTNGIATTADCANHHLVLDKIIPLRCDRNIRFTTGQNTGYGHLFFVIVGDQSTVATNPAFSLTTQLRFSDA